MKIKILNVVDEYLLSNPLFMSHYLYEPHWDPHISGTERCRALKMKTPNEKFIKN